MNLRLLPKRTEIGDSDLFDVHLCFFSLKNNESESETIVVLSQSTTGK